VALNAAVGRGASESSVGRALQRLGLVLKKKRSAQSSGSAKTSNPRAKRSSKASRSSTSRSSTSSTKRVRTSR
jgi:hypothetical protein